MVINRKMLSRVAAATVVIGLAGAGYLFLQYTHRAKASAIATTEEGVPVVAAVAQKQNVPLIVRGIGTVQAYNMVVIKTRVDGAIVKVAFSEGQDVKAGDPLFSSRSIRGRSRRRSTRLRRPRNATRRSSSAPSSTSSATARSARRVISRARASTSRRRSCGR